MTNPNAYLATVVYEDTAGAVRTIDAVILAVDENDAMQSVIEAVSSLPDCAKVLGGMLEPLPDDIMADAQGPNAQGDNVVPMRRPAGRTLH